MKKKKRKNSKQFNRKFRKRFLTKKSVTVLVCAAIILVVIGFGCQRQRKKAEVYRQSIQELNTEIQEIKNVNESLEEEKENVDSDEFKEKIARERLGMIGEDEYSLQKSEGDAGETTGTEPEGETKHKKKESGGQNSSGEDEGDVSAQPSSQAGEETKEETEDEAEKETGTETEIEMETENN